jgi:DNA topoisomerase I
MPMLAAVHADTLNDARAAASAGHLRYVSDVEPGIARIRSSHGFAYRHADGSRVADEATLSRIRKLAVPPAYEQVWICRDARGHLQATGRDARGRKQYRYHPRWREVRDATKFHRMIEFGRALPRLRAHVEAALREKDLTRERVLAMLVLLLDATHIRVGNEEYARSNHSYGLTTMRTHHVELHGQRVRFLFRGKSGIEHDVTFSDRRVARAIHRCIDLPGRELFQYLDEAGARHVVTSAEVNAYLHELTGADFTAKDYRTWAGSVLALDTLRAQRYASTTEAKRRLAAAIKSVAAHLRNTPAVCRRCYVHPAVMEQYLAGTLHELAPGRARAHLHAPEAALLDFLSRAPTPLRVATS